MPGLLLSEEIFLLSEDARGREVNHSLSTLGQA